MATRALSSLSPARRRFVLGAIVVAVVAVVVVAVLVVLSRDEPVTPVSQDRLGPVLLVPGYGGSTTGLEVLEAALDDTGRDARIVAPTGSGTQDLREQAADLGEAVTEVLAETGAPSVDLVGYSAGGVVVRIYVADLGGGSTVRRAVTLASPHHGSDLAALGGLIGSRACPEACRQLAPDSDLLRQLNAGDETPPGPAWVALWTEDDKTVVPADSGELAGALAFAMQSVCPSLRVAHADVPRTPVVIAMVEQVLGPGEPARPGADVCDA